MKPRRGDHLTCSEKRMNGRKEGKDVWNSLLEWARLPNSSGRKEGQKRGSLNYWNT